MLLVSFQISVMSLHMEKRGDFYKANLKSFDASCSVILASESLAAKAEAAKAEATEVSPFPQRHD